MTATATKRKATKKLQDIKAGFPPSTTTIVFEKSQDQAAAKFNLVWISTNEILRIPFAF